MIKRKVELVLNHGSLFSGIGGFDLAAQWCGWNNIFQVEIDKFCQKVLHKNFPNTKKYEDIKKFKGTKYRGRIDVISGGFPCQPFSVAGKRKGKEDDRYLWDEMLRVISEIKPSFVVGENVTGILSMGFGQMLTELESVGYRTETFIIPACAVNAPHKRERAWIVAYLPEIYGLWSDKEKEGRQFQRCDEHRGCFEQEWVSVAAEFCRVDDGISDRVDRLESLGNAIVPQVAYNIFKSISVVQLKKSE